MRPTASFAMSNQYERIRMSEMNTILVELCCVCKDLFQKSNFIVKYHCVLCSTSITNQNEKKTIRKAQWRKLPKVPEGVLNLDKLSLIQWRYANIALL